MRAELATAQRDLGKRQEAQTAAETALLRAQELAAKDQAARQAELERARVEIESLATAAEQLKRERDEAMRESAKLEGRLAAAQGQMDKAKAEIRRLQQVK